MLEAQQLPSFIAATAAAPGGSPALQLVEGFAQLVPQSLLNLGRGAPRQRAMQALGTARPRPAAAGSHAAGGELAGVEGCSQLPPKGRRLLLRKLLRRLL